MESTNHVRVLTAILLFGLLAAACSSSTTAATTDTTEEVVEEEATEEQSDVDADHDEDHDDADHDHDDATAVSLDLMIDGALANDPVLAECTLTNGAASECYTVTVVGTPVGQDVGPFCPTSIDADASEGGLWLDGEASYEIDGPFFTELAEIYGDEQWNDIYNDDGTINVIDNAEDFAVAARPDITEEFYFNCVDGDVTWLEGGEQPTHTVVIPASPTLSDAVTADFATGGHSNLGITFNGALLSGSANVEAILASYTIAAFDDCGGHINPALGYHVHGTAGCSDSDQIVDGETAAFAIALDGFNVHASYAEGTDVELDECNGHTTDELGYHYHANDLEDNETLTCLMGETVEGTDAGGPPGGGGGGGQRPAGGPPADG